MTATQYRLRVETQTAEPVPSGRLRSLQTGHRSMRWLALALPPALAGYALLDKGFAYIRVPGIPIYSGEVLVFIALGAAVIGTSYMRRGFGHSTAAKLLVAFGLFGFARTFPNLG